jgi:uncharacterized protein YjiS (DUF1127 family)
MSGVWPNAVSLLCATQRMIAMLALWRHRSRDRRQLAVMSERELKDLGLSDLDAWREWRKPFWRS